MLQVVDRQIELSGCSTQEIHMAAVERVIQTMRERLCESLSLEDMADTACLSPYYFNRVFHRIVGVPPGEFLATLRLDMAKRLLLTTSLSVTDICFEVGYTGLGSFTTRFTQMVGLPPLRLRNRMRDGTIPRFASPVDTDVDTIEVSPLASANSIEGRILTTRPFNGFIFAGLFPRAIPQGRPVRCTLLLAPGPYHIRHVPAGCYFLLVAALPLSDNPHMYVLPQDDFMVGSAGPLEVRDGGVQGDIDIILRVPLLTDPPVISALPFM